MKYLLNWATAGLLLTNIVVVQAEQLSSRYGDKIGTVHFPVTANPAAADLIERGVALLHHMTYSDAEKLFIKAAELDPGCAMAYWGQAMTILQPLWPSEPDDEMLKQGWEWLQKARDIGIKTKREQAYVEALEDYFRDGASKTERQRLKHYAQGWKRVCEQFPEDLEAAAFYALALMSTASSTDKTYRVQQEAGAIVESIWSKIPDHPGAHHYIIHAYDYPTLAEKALPAARNYGKVAPNVPHALHMPTHIFTRLGLWDESIHWNIRSADIAWLCGIDEGGISTHYLHALDYLVYAYLQTAQDQKALEIYGIIQKLTYKQMEPFIAGSAHAYSAIPARIALERQDWEKASELKARQPVSFPWKNGYAHFEAVLHFAKALGAARSGKHALAQKEIDVLKALRDKAATYNDYWKNQVEIQRLAALAWLQFNRGKVDNGLETMRSAALLEGSTYKHPVTPGEVLPAGELLADMMLENGEYESALLNYEKALKRSPNRFNSLYGAGRAAELAGNVARATPYFKQLIRITTKADTNPDRLAHARAFLKLQKN